MLSIGSKASASQMRRAKNTALGNKSGGGTSEVVQQAAAGGGRGRRLPTGSMEGYDGSRSTYIHMRGSGYDSISSVRGKKGNTNLPTSSGGNPVGMSGIINMNTFDYRYSGSTNNSIKALKGRMELDSI